MGTDPDQSRSDSGRTKGLSAQGTGSLAPSASAVEVAPGAREHADVEARFLVAMHRPRNAEGGRLRILQRCESPRFAEVALYRKPIGGGKYAEGLSVRFAEEAARCWGNLEVTIRLVHEDAERRVLRVTGTDLETNYTISLPVIVEKTVERRKPRPGDEVIAQRTNASGQAVFVIAATDEATLLKANALVAKSKRQVQLELIPGDIVEEAREVLRRTRAHEGKRDPNATSRVVGAFEQLGVKRDQLARLFPARSLERLEPAELEDLRGVYTAIKEGEATWEEIEAGWSNAQLARPDDRTVRSGAGVVGKRQAP